MTGSANDDRRRFHRVGHDARATLSYARSAWDCTVQDLSLKGCLVRLASDWPLDGQHRYHLTVHLSEDVRIDMEVMRAHQEGFQVGLRCVDIDLDSATRLRRLVELNLGDQSLLERDLQALVRG